MIEFKNIDKKFNPSTVNETIVFDNMSLSIGNGEFVSVIGSNGSGKTTLLNLASGTVFADGGSITLGGEDITREKDYIRARRIGRVYQDPTRGTAPMMSIIENISLAENKGKKYGLSTAVSKKKIDYYKQLVSGLGLGLEDKMNVSVGSLSGGQRQALTLLIATLTPIDLLLLDEHTAALDPKTSETIMELTDKIVREKKVTTLMVTHNLRYAVNYGDRLLMMDKGKFVVDAAGDKKSEYDINSLLKIFNSISIECGN